MPGGFWKRPTNRTYAYNLDLGEHYYYPMTYYLDRQRGSRGSSPGALTYSERLAQRWIGGRKYGQSDLQSRYSRADSMGRTSSSYARSSSVGPYTSSYARGRSVGPTSYSGLSSSSYLDREYSARAAASRARSEMRVNREATPPFEPEVDPWNVSAFGRYKQALVESARELRASSMARSNEIANRRNASYSEAAMARQAASEAAEARRSQIANRSSAAAASSSSSSSTSIRDSSVVRSESRRVTDDISKRVADLHMMPWSAGHELDEAQAASVRARSRIQDLERELDEITKRALTTSSYGVRSASAMAKQALMEDEAAMASSYKKTRKVMVDSSSRMA